ncbi:TonB-dependent receptor domain-containing protein [Silvibacterium sp.]|uniref:TonB-dependent receptor n=1 Tax=Silvibacterium sp. TaxID=1964179 RepID=UPI0039E632C7
MLLLCAVLAAIPAWAQSPTGGAVSGTIRDAGGRLFAALITLRNTATGDEIQVLSDRKGNFRFGEVAPGVYTMRINAPGFAVWRAESVTVEVGRVTAMTAQLTMAAIEPKWKARQRKTVAAAQPALSDNLDEGAVDNLPSATGDRSAAAGLSAGAVTPAVGADEAGAAAGVSYRGLSPMLNAATVDGIDNTLAFHAQTRGNTSGGYATAQAAIREFQVSTANAGSEYGHAAGGVVSTVTRGGSNHLHGEAAFYDRDAAWGAGNGYQSLTEKDAAGDWVSVPYKPTDVRREGSASAGGPLRRDKLFWLGAFEMQRRDFPGVARANLPETFFAAPSAQNVATLAARAGLSDAAALTAWDTALGELAGMLGNVPRTANQENGFARLDWRPNNRHSLLLEAGGMGRKSTNGALAAATETYGVGSFGTSSTTSETAIGGWTYTVSPSLLNAARFGYSRERLAQLPSKPAAFEQTLTSAAWGLAPQVAVDRTNGFTFGTRTASDKRAYPDEQRQQFVDGISWVHHKHAVKLGFDYGHVQDVIDGLNGQTGAYSYSSLLNFMSDLIAPDSCDGSSTGAGKYPCYSYYRQTVGLPDWSIETEDYGAYLSDEWKLTRRLTLSAGVRYERERLPDTNRTVVNAALPQTGFLPQDRNNYGPRAGFAWDIFGSGRTVIEAGAGVAYGRIPNAAVYSAVTLTGSGVGAQSYYAKPLDVGAPPFPYVFGASSVLPIVPQAVYFDRHFQNPEVMQGAATLQQRVGRQTVVSLSGIVALSRELMKVVDRNVDLTTTGTIRYTIDDPDHLGPLDASVEHDSRFYYKRLNPAYDAIYALESETNAKYEAGTLKLTRRQGAMQFNIGYTYAHAWDGNPATSALVTESGLYDPLQPGLEWAASSFDARQRIAGQVVLHEPWHFKKWAGRAFTGYTLAMTGEWRSGLPYSMQTTGSIPALACSYEQWLQSGADCAAIDDPGVITGSYVPISGLGESLNGLGGGNLVPWIGRNTYRRPPVTNMDVRVAKRTSLTERVSLEVMAEAFNALNHQNVTSIETIGYYADNSATETNDGRLTYLSGATGKSAFGTVTSANTSAAYRQRQLQAGVKLRF